MKTLTVIISLTLYLFCVPGFGNAAIVCFGDDGHVSVKSTSSPSLPAQKTKITDHRSESPENDHCEDHCNSCIDFPLSFSTSNQHISKHTFVFKLARNPLQPSDTECLPFFVSQSCGSLFVPLHPASHPILISLRTIVLLI